MSSVFLKDIGLKEYTLDGLPRLRELRQEYFQLRPEICIERALYITQYLRDFDESDDGPEVRQAKKIRHFLSHKEPAFHDANLLAGTTTSKPLGAPLFPEYFALTLWPELETVSTRSKNPQILSAEDAKQLNLEIFPFWMERNVLEVTRKRYNNPDCMRLFEELIFFIAGKAGCISHCVPTYQAMLTKGLSGIMAEASERETQLTRAGDSRSLEQTGFFRAARIALEGIVTYANRLAEQAEMLAGLTDKADLRKELEETAAVCRRVPQYPATTFREAINAIWICQVGIHAENINMAMSPGRLDQVLFPYYKKDMETGRLDVAKALELVGCLWFKLSDNVIMVPQASEEMFGGAGTAPAVTLGGVDSRGEDAVNDLTYIMLRATELLRIRDPNVNARFFAGKNPMAYARRVSEVILNTKAVPAFFNDESNIAALQGQGETIEHARDYAVVGCVELASSGRDYLASSSIMLNLIAPLEMALFQGRRPVTGERQIGPETQDPARMQDFESFWNAFSTQLDWVIAQAVQLNEYLGHVHQEMMPSPLLSSFFEGPLEKGRDLIRGGALYNSSGATHIGFADVVDSLNAIEFAVFGERKYTFDELIAAVKGNFAHPGDEKLRQYLRQRAPKYGTENPIALKNSARLIGHLYDVYQGYTNYRGGPYRPAYWTMTNHAGLGGVCGALPNGRKAGEVFASGITPVSGAAPELTACLNSVASLGGPKVPGGWALNLKYTPTPDPEKTADRFAQTIQAYFQAGGQQVQFNIMTYEMLMDARKHPEKYPELMVRVSGYSAYFKDLNDLMKNELITRTQYDLMTGKAEPFPGQ